MAVRMMGVIVLALVAGPPCSEPVKTADETTVTVCIDLPASLPWGARVLASRMLGREGVRIEWRSMDDCRGLTGAIELRFSDDTTPYADTLAFAEPYQGTHIVVYTDRVQAIQKSKC